MSLSARRAWIEIQCNTVIDGQSAVSLSARRAWIEIDAIVVQAANSSVSLSARRAWIEILGGALYGCYCLRVALRKESVDRNMLLLVSILLKIGRSPQGERG